MNSDEDSANEDEGGLVDNLSGRQSRSQAEIVFVDQRRLGNFEDNESKEQDQGPKRKQKRNKKKTKKFSRKREDLLETISMFPEPKYSEYRNQTPLQIFDEKIINMIITESNRYAIQKNSKN